MQQQKHPLYKPDGFIDVLLYELLCYKNHQATSRSPTDVTRRNTFMITVDVRILVVWFSIPVIGDGIFVLFRFRYQ